LRQLRRQAGVAEQGVSVEVPLVAARGGVSFPSTYRCCAEIPIMLRMRRRDAAPEADPALAEYLREWRRNMARENKVPAYIILHDSTLEELCRRRPANLAAS
jgi:superfamily II DNA helicase RecQ